MKRMPLVLALLLSLNAHAEKKTPEQYWSETGLSMNALVDQINILEPAVCVNSLKEYRGCVAAVNSVAATAKMRFVPNNSAREEGFGEVVQVFGDFSLVKVQEITRKESLRDTVKRGQERQARIDREINALFQKTADALKEMVRAGGRGRTNVMNFEKAIVDLKALVARDASDALTAADAITAFATEAIDGHARIQAAAEFKDSTSDADTSFAGIGANLQDMNGKIVVVSPIEGGPAEKAGLLANDVIEKVDGEPVAGLKLDEVVKKIRGKETTTVWLVLNRNGRAVDMPIVRGKIKVENVEAKLVNDMGRPVGHIKLRSFVDRNACATIEAKIAELTEKGATGLILDLRANGGGLLDQAICIGGLFVGNKVVVKVKDLQSDQFEEPKLPERDAATKLPLAVLIDSGSASASEVVSGALQDHMAGWLVGERSFGKGTVQSPSGFFNRNIMLWRTIQRFYQPLEHTNQIRGISPEVAVPVKPDATEDELFRLREADLFPNHLEAIGPERRETRQGRVNELNDCVSKSARALTAYKQSKASSRAVDYQLLVAEEVLSCSQPGDFHHRGNDQND